MTTTWWSRIAAAMSSRRSTTGRCSGYVMGGTVAARAARRASRCSGVRRCRPGGEVPGRGRSRRRSAVGSPDRVWVLAAAPADAGSPEAGRRRPRRRGGRERAGAFAGSSGMVDRIGARRRPLRTDIPPSERTVSGCRDQVARSRPWERGADPSGPRSRRQGTEDLPWSHPSEARHRCPIPSVCRPALPDPQRDRHVSFPDEAPDERRTKRRTQRRAVPPTVPRTGCRTCGGHRRARPCRPRPGRPGRPPGPRGARDDSMVTAGAADADHPAGPPAPRRRRSSWLLLVPLMLGSRNGRYRHLHHRRLPVLHRSRSGDVGLRPWRRHRGRRRRPPLRTPGWASGPGRHRRGTTFAPLLGGTPKVSPVPADAARFGSRSCRPPASSAGLEAQVDTTVEDSPIDTWFGSTPHALEMHLDERPTRLKVSAKVTSGSGTVQCRVYAGNMLVAVDTSGSMASCKPQM